MNVSAAVTEMSTSERRAYGGWSGRLEALETFLALFAKAVRALHTYPVTSQVAADAVTACRANLAAIDGPDEISLTVTPDALLLHEHPVGESEFVKHELNRRIRRARVAGFTIQRDCTARDLTRFCLNLVRCSESIDGTISIGDLMAEDGIEAITVEVLSRREVLPVAPSMPAQRELVAHERRRREEVPPNTRRVNLFPPHRGWIRLDPAESYDLVSLADLAILVDDPNELASLLHRLAEDNRAESASADTPLDRRFGDVSALFAGLEPRLSRVMFAKLARVLMDMETGRRQELLKRTILPSIFEGRPGASVLHALSDADLADALCLLFDAQSGSTGLAMSALDQLKLDPERRALIVPLMEAIMRARIDPALGLDAATAIALDQQARRLTRIEPTERRSFVELAGLDFRLDETAHTTIQNVCTGIRETDGLMMELLCLVNLIGLQPNPEVAASFVQSTMDRGNQLVQAGRWSDLATALERLCIVTAGLRERRPEVTALVDDALHTFATPEFASALLDQRAQDSEAQAMSVRVLDALGPAIVPALVSLLESGAQSASGAVSLMSERASLFAPALADGIPSSDRQTRACIARVLGYAGAGFEDHLGGLCDPKDEKTTREALRSLNRIATARAAELVGVVTRDARNWLATAGVETLLRFHLETAGPAIRDVLAHRPFVITQPAAASRLMGRLRDSKTPDLEPVLRDLWSLRFRIWNRALVRVARDAGALLNR